MSNGVSTANSSASSEPLRISFLGPLGTYSHQAATDFFGSSSDFELLPVERIGDVFESVSSSSSDFGVVPIENSSFGSVVETAQNLRTTSLSVRGMIQLKIGHSLLSREGAAEDAEGKKRMKRVYSHEQGIGQCRAYLAEHYPQVEIIPVNSTAKAAQQVLEDAEGLAICSLKCAEVYGLDVVDTDIQDAGFSNTTRFICLSKANRVLPDVYPIQRSKQSNAETN
ncbi:prephenate dehydratase PHA2 [Sporobolomyces salmoneus]|uniref:prephenate dehydratase PHA2 n=1 Tax=Sporobolomyces salmoneus TaxID=183962 RepID=UPI00317CA9AC